MKYLLMLILALGSFAAVPAYAGCADKCSTKLEKPPKKCEKAHTARALQGCATAAQQGFYACQSKCARGTGVDAEMAPVSRRAKKKANEYTNHINARCLAQWGDNYRMQKYCRKKQLKAFGWIVAHIKRYKLDQEAHQKGPHFKITSHCWTQWTDQWKGNWPMIKYCIEKQEAAYKSLN